MSHCARGELIQWQEIRGFSLHRTNIWRCGDQPTWDPLQVSLHPRATPFADLAGWIRLFGQQFLEGIMSEDEPELVNEVVASCRESGACRWDEEKRLWYLDYVRLRIIAVKAG